MTFHEMYPYLCIKNAMEAIDFYAHVFPAAEKFRLTEPKCRFGHADLDFNGTTLMLSDEFPEYDIKGPHTLGGTPVTIHLHVDNADAIIRGAAQMGATIDTEPQDQVYDERSGTFPPSPWAPLEYRPQPRRVVSGRDAETLYEGDEGRVAVTN